MLYSTAQSMGRQPRKWTMEEDRKLREQVEAQMSEGEVKDWCRIAASLPGRTNKDCRKRWHNSVAGGLKKGQWSKTEDVQLSRGVQKYGQRWTLVANIVGSRSADQCAKRWQQSLDPDLDRSEWCEKEDKILIEAVQRLGRHWKDIQRHHFPGRSKNCIKNRYTVLVRRYQNQGITLPPPAGSPEPSLVHYVTDDDTNSYTSSIPDDFQTTYIQVSTPETQHSWPIDPSQYTDWTTQDAFSTAISAPSSDFTSMQLSQAIQAPQWPWTATPISQQSSPMLFPSHHQSYFNVDPPVTLPAYDVFGGAQVMLNPSQWSGSGMYARGPTSSPVPSAMDTAPYQDVQTMYREVRYGVQRHPGFQH